MTWRRVPLNALLDYSIGGVWGNAPGDDEIDVDVVRVTELRRHGRIDPATAARRSVSRKQLESRELRVGDLLLEKSGGGPSTPVGRVGLIAQPIAPSVCSNFMQLMRPDTRLIAPRYLHLYLNHLHDTGGTVPMQTASTNIRNIKASDYIKLQVPMPEVEDQLRIVDILEDHLSRLDAALKYVAAAVRRNELLRWASLARAVDEAGGEPRTVGEVAVGVKNGIFVSRPGQEPHGVPILRIGAVRSLSLDLSDLRYSAMSLEQVRQLDGLLSTDDVVFTRYNGNPEFVGACTTVPATALPLTYPDKLIRVRVDPSHVIAEFLAMACSVGAPRAQIRAAVKTTSGQAGISGRDLKAVAIRVPPVTHQRRVVEHGRGASEGTRRLRDALALQSQRTERLRRALLEAAFAGHLTGRSSDLDAVEELAGSAQSP